MAQPTDGHRTVYRCESCGQSMVTVRALDLTGVTPMFLTCRADPGCGGRMSRLIGVMAGEPTHCWRKPLPKDLATARRMGRDAFDYLKRGGLLLDAIPTPAPDTTQGASQ